MNAASTPGPRSATGREIPRVALLVALTVLVWCFAHQRWTWEAWQTPLEYGTTLDTSDAKTALATIKAAQDGHFTPFLPKRIPELGAPTGADWDDLPIVEQFTFWVPGLLARGIGLMPAANVAVLLAQLLAALAFYATCRALRCEWRWAIAGALVFAFARMAMGRQLHHLVVTYYWHVPLCLLACWWITAAEPLWRTRRHAIALGIAVITGVQNPYYTNLFVQLAGLASLVCLFQRRWLSAAAGISVVAVAMAAFFAMNVPLFIAQARHGPNPDAVVRKYSWLEYYALKPIDLAMPPPDHPVAALAGHAQRYAKETMLGGEVPASNYLGLFGLLALGYLLWRTAANALHRPPLPVPGEFWQVAWIFAYAGVGGWNGVAGTFGLHLFRSTNRLSIFILAIALIFAIRALSRLRLPAPAVTALALAVAVAALWEQLPPPPTRAAIAETAAEVAADRQFVAAMESALPPGTMVFQAPPIPYPESTIPGVAPYDYLRPYLYAHHLRFSFGTVKGRPERDRWQTELTRGSIADAVATLEAYGFGAIAVYHDAFPDGGAAILNALSNLGRTERIPHPSGKITVVRLRPHSPPTRSPTE